MKLKSVLLILTTVLCFTTANAQLFVEDAMKFAALVPDSSMNCSAKTKPCAIFNKSANRAIKVKIEQSVTFNNKLSTKILVFENLAPNEKRYIGCAGRIAEGANIKATGYKIMVASFEEADSTKVRNLLNDTSHDNDSISYHRGDE